MIGIRTANGKDVEKTPIKDLSQTSEANQWKIHKTGTVVATGANQIFTIEHGLSYTPAYIVFKKDTANTYYEWKGVGGNNYIDSTKLSIQLASSGDMATYIIFKDFGA